MEFLSFLFLATTIILLLSTIGISILEERTRKRTRVLEQQVKLAQYEVEALRQLNRETPYGLTITRIAQNTAATVEKLLPFSTISYGVLDQYVFTIATYIKKEVGKEYLESIQKIVYSSASELSQKARENSPKIVIEGKMNERNKSLPLSYFTIPLVVAGEFRGVLTIASEKKGVYHEAEMKLMYLVIRESLREIEKVNEVIETETGKLNSLLLSIPSGAIVFLLGHDNMFKLSTINASAREFLHLSGEVSTSIVIEALGSQIDIPIQFKKILDEKKEIKLKDIDIFGRAFKVFIRPVFLYGTGKILGVTITLQDMTLERQLQEIRDTFTNMVVHELRAPLTSIKGASELLLSGELKDIDKMKMISLIKGSSENMLSQIGELLDAAKIDAGKFVLKKERYNLNTLLQQRVDVFQPIAQQKQINLKLEQENIPEFEFDRERIGQIMNNLLSNAIKFTHQSGSIIVRVNLEKEFVLIMVSDNGIGIPPSKQATLFSKYQQVGEAGTRVSGTGLGLYISKNIIESHGGKIWFESQENKGTTFYFTIPIQNSAPVPKTQKTLF